MLDITSQNIYCVQCHLQSWFRTWLIPNFQTECVKKYLLAFSAFGLLEFRTYELLTGNNNTRILFSGKGNGNVLAVRELFEQRK